MLDPAAVQARYAAEIREAASRFGDHEGMTEGTILHWMVQFAEEHLPLAEKILRTITYFSSSNIRAMTRELARMIVADFGGDPQRIIFVPIEDHPGGGSSTIARVLYHLPAIRGSRIVKMSDLEGMDKGNARAVAFFDDFSGTGDQFEDWWLSVEPLVRPLGIPVVIGLLVMTTQARERIQSFVERVLSVRELNGRYNMLSPLCTTFDNGEKEALTQYCRRTGCGLMYIMGYGSSGLLLAFTHGCPDDSLPILWYDSGNWRTLFRRHAI